MSCPNCNVCPLYHVMNQDEKRSAIIAEICLDDETYKKCERFLRMERGEKVPATLMPDGSDLRAAGSKK